MITVFLALILVGSVHFGHAQTGSTLSGIIRQDTTWTKIGSPYTLTGPTAVAEGATLTIEPGTTVNFNSYYLQVNGTLQAKGTTTNNIRFNQFSPTSSAQIEFMEPSASWNQTSATGSIIQNAYCNTTGISINGASPKISNSSGILRISIYGGSPIISNNNLDESIYFAEGSPLIVNNTINGFIGSAYHTGGYNDLLDSRPVIMNNTLSSLGDGGQGIIDLGGCSPIIANNTILGIHVHTPGVEQRAPPEDYYTGYGVSFDRDEFGGANMSGASTQSALIFNNVISNTFKAGINIASGNAVIEANNITSNGDGIDVGTAANVTVLNSTIAAKTAGFSLNDPESLSVHYSNIQNGIYLLPGSSNNVNATYNWWGTTDTAAISQVIHDFKNDFNLGNVTFVPFLDSPNPEAAPNLDLSISNFTSGSATPTQTPTSTSSPSPTLTPSPSTPSASPSIPEFSVWVILPLMFVASVFAVLWRRRKKKA